MKNNLHEWYGLAGIKKTNKKIPTANLKYFVSQH